MKIYTFGFFCVALVVLVTGCAPDLAQIEPGSREEFWQHELKKSYSGFRHSRVVAPAVADDAANNNSCGSLGECRGGTCTAIHSGAPAPATDPGAEAAGAILPPPVEEKAPAAVETATPAPAGEVLPVEPTKEEGGVIAPEAAPETAREAVVYEVKSGDTLSHIAKKFYGNASHWEIIANANTDVLPNVKKLRPGMKLRIPQL